MNLKIRKKIYYSILISLIIHIGFLAWSFFVKMIPSSINSSEEKVIQVNILRPKPAQPKALAPKDSSSTKSVNTDNLFLLTNAQTKQQPVLSTPLQSVGLNVPQAHRNVVKKSIHSVRRDLLELGAMPLPIMDKQGDLLSDRRYAANAHLVSENSQVGNNVQVTSVFSSGSSAINRQAQGSDLGTILTYELSKYQDPNTKAKYFKLLVKVRDATVNFPVIPKEIVFLMDSSESIGQERLNQFKLGVIYSLQHLNAKDRFNIFIFKDKTIPLSPASLSVDKRNIKKATRFLDSISAGSTTNVYSALQVSVNLKDTFTPSYRMLLSDGFPTRGITDARQVINEISKINSGKVSIFAFGGGGSVSKYMLDFIAYKNRGWSQVAEREFMISRELSQMYEKIRDPLLLNLRYHISGLNEGDVFPQILPDFFKGSEFVIYGTYTDENKFIVQVIGDVPGSKKAFMISAALNDAVIADKDIARQWAFHKVYHLIGELKHNEKNAALIKRIDELCAQFNIITPYSKNFRGQ